MCLAFLRFWFVLPRRLFVLMQLAESETQYHSSKVCYGVGCNDMIRDGMGKFFSDLHLLPPLFFALLQGLLNVEY